MKKLNFLLFLYLILLLILFNNIVCSGDICTDSEGRLYICGDIDAKLHPTFTSPLDNKTPNYQVISMVDNKTIDGGKNFIISFQISGYGKIVANKLVIYFPKELLKDNPKFYLYIIQQNYSDNVYCAWTNKKPKIVTVDKEGSIISIVNVAFIHNQPNGSVIFGEMAIYGHSPICIHANTSDVPTGDYPIKIKFFYSDGISWYSSEDEVSIHVRSWAEKNELLIYLIIPFATAIIGAVIGLKLKLKRKKS
jgi:hypothetical protein